MSFIPTTSSANNNYSPPQGNKPFFSNYAPVNSSYWPSHEQVGWNVDDIDPSNTNNTIEVLLPNYHMIKTPVPDVLF